MIANSRTPIEAKDEWRTPLELFQELDLKFNFTLDPAATHENALCGCHFTKEDDGLSKDWKGSRVFLNPPFSSIPKWIRKCLDEQEEALIVALLPNWTDRAWYQELKCRPNIYIDHLSGRIHYSGSKGCPPWGSMLVYFL